MVSASNMLDR